MKRATFFRLFARDRRGISSVEYALLLAFVGGGIIVAAAALSQAVTGEMNNAASCISGGDPASPACS